MQTVPSMAGNQEVEGNLPASGRLYTSQELLNLFELEDGDMTEMLKRIPHSKLEDAIIISGNSAREAVIAFGGVEIFVAAVRGDRDK